MEGTASRKHAAVCMNEHSACLTLSEPPDWAMHSITPH